MKYTAALDEYFEESGQDAEHTYYDVKSGFRCVDNYTGETVLVLHVANDMTITHVSPENRSDYMLYPDTTLAIYKLATVHTHC